MTCPVCHRSDTAYLNCNRPDCTDGRHATPTQIYNVGPETMAKVFKPNGLTNLSDLQKVLDAVEAALSTGVTVPEAAKVLWDHSNTPVVYDACANRVRAYKFQAVLRAIIEAKI